MNNVQNYSNTELIDLLSSETTKLSKLLIDPFSPDEYKKCKLFIRALIAEIEHRKLFNKDGTVNERGISLNPD
jgi:hypothetical protein